MRSSLVLASALLSTSLHAAPSCFSTGEVEAANLRVLQQQFNVAALNCQTSEPSDPTFAERYNRFVKLFAKQLQSNGDVLLHHFGMDSRTLDRWMTRVANDAGQSVYKKQDFCQVAWDRLEAMNALSGEQMEAYATQTAAADDLAPRCPETTVASVRKKTPSK